MRRHPHVFGDVKADTPAEVLRNWEALKAEERKKQRSAEDFPKSIFDGISSAMPSLLEAHKLSSRAAQVGFEALRTLLNTEVTAPAGGVLQN